jgi:hypothetical protein
MSDPAIAESTSESPVVAERSYQPPANDVTATPDEPAVEAPKVESKVEDKAEKTEASSKKTVPDKVKRDGKGDWVQSRIQHYSSEAKQLREQVQAMQKELESVRSGKTQDRRDPSSPPQQENYEKYSDYVDALVDWKVGQREASSKQEQAYHTSMQEFSKRQSEFGKHLVSFASGYDQPEEVLQAITDDNLPITPAMGDAIMHLGPKGAEVMWHLAQNPMEAMEIAQMSPSYAAMKIGMLSMKIGESVVAPAQAEPTKPQPKPIPSIRGGSPANDMDNEPKDTDIPTVWAQKVAAKSMRLNPSLRMYIPR